jgi:hypothetical protein
MKGTWQTDSSGSGGTIALIVGAAVLAAAVAGPVMAAAADLVRAVVIIVIAAVALAAIGVAAAVALRLRHWPPRALPSRVYGSTSVHPVQDRPVPRALPARQPEVHLHFHGVTAEDIATALGHFPGDRQS